jgi:hypothetical protein
MVVAKSFQRARRDMQRVIAEQRLGYVASVCPDGTANLSPKGTVAVWAERHVRLTPLSGAQLARAW